MILAGIDIGTNTLRLLIVDIGPDSYREISSAREITRLGQDLDRTGLLSRDARERSMAALANFSANISRHAVRQSAAVGTSALRKASNSTEFLTDVKKRTGLDVRVITGQEEARLTLLGVGRALREASEAGQEDALSSALVMDIGGGSTELIVTRLHAEPMEASLPLGAVYLTERFIMHDPPSHDELDRLRRSIRDELERHGDVLPLKGPRFLVGTAGTVTTLAAMELRLAEYDPEQINRSTLTRGSIDDMVRRLSASTLQERRQMTGLEHGREDIILAGAVVAQEIMARFGYKTMRVSDWGLREGIVFDLYEMLREKQGAESRR